MTNPDMARLITDNYDKLRRYSRKAGAVSEDVFQEACVTIMESETFNPEYPAGSWLFRHVMSARAKVLRGVYSYTNAGLTLRDDRSVEASQEFVVDASAARRAVAHMPERTQEVLSLTSREYTLSEVGQELGISKQAAHVHLRAARAELGRLAA